MSKATLYLKCRPDDLGDLVLLTGAPERVQRIAAQLDSPQTIAQNREFVTVTGQYQGQRVSALSSGIGAPSAAIAVEELAQLGVRAVVRVGTTMGITAPMGSYVLSTGAVRREGTSPAYLPLEYPAVPDWTLAQHLAQSAQKQGLPLHTGITATYDGFYTHMAPSLVGRGALPVEELKAAGVLALDMETALLYILATRLGIAAASFCIVTNSAVPFQVLEGEARSQGEDRLISSVLDSLINWRNAHA